MEGVEVAGDEGGDPGARLASAYSCEADVNEAPLVDDALGDGRRATKQVEDVAHVDLVTLSDELVEGLVDVAYINID